MYVRDLVVKLQHCPFAADVHIKYVLVSKNHNNVLILGPDTLQSHIDNLLLCGWTMVDE